MIINIPIAGVTNTFDSEVAAQSIRKKRKYDTSVL